jgi:hypothetical protein
VTGWNQQGRIFLFDGLVYAVQLFSFQLSQGNVLILLLKK